MKTTFYVTTPIYYVNDVPHIGHSYTTVAADILARYFRKAGRDVRFLTGTDEHGIKIVKAAAEKGTTPRQLADDVVVHFESLWRDLDILNDDFIRTSQPRHESRVQEIIRQLVAIDEIYQGSYQGWYDEGQEEFVTESTARENEYVSSINGKPLVRYSEPSYFFRLSKWIPALIKHIEQNEDFIRPHARRNEVLSKLAAGVEDLSISRSKEKLGGWGIEMPNDPTHSVYVWVDALSNYYTALGCPAVGDEHDLAHEKYWPADVHLIGKDILWFHAVYWPCILMALKVPLPKTIFAHGWWTSEGKKMSKTLGNFVSREQIADICQQYSVDVYRWFLMRAVTFGNDGDFSAQSLRVKYNTELANGLGNLLSRTVNMIGRYFDGVVPARGEPTDQQREVLDNARTIVDNADEWMGNFQFHSMLEGIVALVDATNRYIDTTQPFKLAKEPDKRPQLETIMSTCAEAVRLSLEYLDPFMPQTAARGKKQLGCQDLPASRDWGEPLKGRKVEKGDALFPRKE